MPFPHPTSSMELSVDTRLHFVSQSTILFTLALPNLPNQHNLHAMWSAKFTFPRFPFLFSNPLPFLEAHPLNPNRGPEETVSYSSGQSIISAFLAYNIGNTDNICDTGILSLCFTARCTIVQSAVLRLYVARLSIHPSVCNVTSKS